MAYKHIEQNNASVFRGDVIQCFCKVGAAPTNKLHGLSPCDLKRERILKQADKKTSATNVNVKLATAKRKKKFSQLRASVKIISRDFLVIHTCLCITCA